MERWQKDGKVLHKLMSNVVYGKNNGKLEKKNRYKTCNQQKKTF